MNGGADVNMKDLNEQTPLDIAKMKGNLHTWNVSTLTNALLFTAFSGYDRVVAILGNDNLRWRKTVVLSHKMNIYY